MYRILLLALFAGFVSCKSESSENEEVVETSFNRAQLIDTLREEINKAPVAVYDVPLPANLNNWHFTVKLFETRRMFDYRLEMEYEAVTGEETITIPNFGLEPKPVIKKGKSDLECIVGFLDKTDTFREYIKVYVKDGDLRMKTIQHYAVYEK